MKVTIHEINMFYSFVLDVFYNKSLNFSIGILYFFYFLQNFLILSGNLHNLLFYKYGQPGTFLLYFTQQFF